MISKSSVSVLMAPTGETSESFADFKSFLLRGSNPSVTFAERRIPLSSVRCSRVGKNRHTCWTGANNGGIRCAQSEIFAGSRERNSQTLSTGTYFQPSRVYRGLHRGRISHSRRNTMLVNVWAIQRDVAVWEHPTEFDPECFLNSGKEIDVKGHNFELIPFGSGRRMCPAIHLALSVVSHTLARLLQSFEWSAPEGTEIYMTEGIGFTMCKAIPLEAIIKPRLPLHLY